MKKNTLYRLYAAVFLGICLVPSALMPFVNPEDSKEKRELAEVPKIKTENGKLNFNFFDEFETYFSEHFAFRQKLVTLDGKIRAELFGTSSNSDVIVGKDGWLYYAPTADDFMHVNSLSERGINNICHNLEMMYDYCRENGAEFIFTIAPNKNSLYPKYMPFNYIQTGSKDNYEKLSESLNGGFYCDMKKALLETEASIPLYHKEDTHWNNLGAYAGHAALMKMLGREICPSGNWTAKNDRQGDLAAMIYPDDKPDDMQVYTDYEFEYSYTSRFRSFDDINITTACIGKEGKLLMYRDSYGEAIIPFIAECFGSAEFTRSVPYRMDSVGNGGADTVILEIVERNIGNLQKYAPVMSAPETDMQINAERFSNDLIVKIEESGKYLHIFGVLGDEFFIGDSARIFVNAGEHCYESFNAFEDRLLEREGEVCDNGFSLYIPADTAVSLEEISVTVLNPDGTAVSSE